MTIASHFESTMLRPVGIVLCGGASRRMGRPKHLIEIDGEALLVRVVKAIQTLVADVIVAAGRNQPLPTLPGGVTVVRDRQDHAGPLAGFVNAMDDAHFTATHSFLVGCDMPYFNAKVARFLMYRFEELNKCRIDQPDILVPLIADQLQPLFAVYPRLACESARRLLERGETSMHALLESYPIHVVCGQEIESLDPGLRSFQPFNTPADLKSARDAAFE